MILTKHERAARRWFAEICKRPAAHWSIVRQPEPGTWYDFADPVERRYGQCRRSDDGQRWDQEPLGAQPVILAARRP